MGLFDKFRSPAGNNSSFSLEEASSGVLLGVMGVDGHISDEEIDMFQLIVNRHSIFKDQSAADFRRMMDKMMQLLKKQGWKTMIEKCATDIPTAMKPVVFALAVDFTFADGNVEDEEKELIAFLQSKLELDDNQAEAIVEVLAVKNGMI